VFNFAQHAEVKLLRVTRQVQTSGPWLDGMISACAASGEYASYWVFAQVMNHDETAPVHRGAWYGSRRAACRPLITGVGFLGAGVILHRPTGSKVHGLTTAAIIWITASLGVLCGLAAWRILAIAVFLILFLLIAGGPIENW
jgi:uncharacterized membrane protein YhiD involved in acid resistance